MGQSDEEKKAAAAREAQEKKDAAAREAAEAAEKAKREQDDGNGDEGEKSDGASGEAPRSTGATTNPHANVPGDLSDEQSDIEDMAREINLQRIDPVTGQRLADFDPDVAGMDEATRDLVLGNKRFGGVEARAQALQRTVEARQAHDEAQARAEEELKASQAANKLPKQETTYVDPATYKARQAAIVQAEAKALNTKNTIPGGRFLVNGEWVNANGDLIDENGRVLQRRG